MLDISNFKIEDVKDIIYLENPLDIIYGCYICDRNPVKIHLIATYIDEYYDPESPWPLSFYFCSEACLEFFKLRNC